MHMYVPNLNHFHLPITLSHCLFFPLKLYFQKFFLVLWCLFGFFWTTEFDHGCLQEYEWWNYFQNIGTLPMVITEENDTPTPSTH